MTVIVIIIFYAAVGFFEINPLIKKRKYKELWVYSSLFGLAFVISLLMGMGIEIPSPAEPIHKVVSIFTGK